MLPRSTIRTDGNNVDTIFVAHRRIMKDYHGMNTTSKRPLILALVVVVALVLLFGGGAMTGGTMNGGMHGGWWMGERSWMWAPALLALCLGIGLGWIIFKKKE